MQTSMQRSTWWVLVDLGIGALIAALGYWGLSVVALPGLLPAFLIQWLARSIWAWRGESGQWEAFDGDELPGPAAWVLGTVLAWWVIVHGLRRVVWARFRGGPVT